LLLDQVVPWGRLDSEYINMFALTPQDMLGRIIDCAGGPSSFNSELTGQDRRITSCDPLYSYSTGQIQERIDTTAGIMLSLTEANKDNFRWEEFRSPQQLNQMRMRAMRVFMEDYDAGKAAGRYVTGELPNLPFEPDSFDIALCSHFLFTYSDVFSTDFHLASIIEMARVASQVRIFPLLNAFSSELSVHLEPIMQRLRELGYGVEVVRVAYEFQNGGNRMLCVSRARPEG